MGYGELIEVRKCVLLQYNKSKLETTIITLEGHKEMLQVGSTVAPKVS